MTDRQQLRVLVISEYYPKPGFPVYGIFVRRQVAELAKNCQVTVVCPVRVFPPLRLFKSLLTFNLRRFALQLDEWLDDVLRTPSRAQLDGVDVLYPRYTSGPNQILHPTVGWFARLFLGFKLKRLHLENDFDIVHGHYAVPSGTLAAWCATRFGIPAVLSIHGRDFNYTAQKGGLNRRLLARIFNAVDLICSNSGRTTRLLLETGAKSEKIELVELGSIDPQPGPVTVKKNGPLTVLAAGNLYPNKKFDITIRAFADLVGQGIDLKLEIVGDGSEREKLENLAAALDVSDKITFRGRLAPDQMPAQYDSCDIFALPAVDEAFGLVYIEALARGKPVIGCKGEGGPQDLAARGDCIILVEPNDHHSLAEAISRLAASPELRQRLAETGKKIVENYYTWPRNAARTVELYQSLIENKYR